MQARGMSQVSGSLHAKEVEPGWPLALGMAFERRSCYLQLDTMFALLIGVGALFLAVFVSAIFDPPCSHTRSAGERTSVDGESDCAVDDILRERTVRRWRWGSLRPAEARRRAAFTASGDSVLCHAAA